MNPSGPAPWPCELGHGRVLPPAAALLLRIVRAAVPAAGLRALPGCLPQPQYPYAQDAGLAAYRAAADSDSTGAAPAYYRAPPPRPQRTHSIHPILIKRVARERGGRK